METTDQSQAVVLVVEDEPVLQMLASAELEQAGFAVLEAANADEALRLLDQHASTVKVLFTDVDMPGSMDGLALAQEANRRWPHLLLLITSAHHQLANGQANGHFLPKPYGAAAVIRHIHDWMAARSGS